MVVEFTAWDRLMDRACEIWVGTSNYRDALFRCTGPERVAMVLGHLNYQVNNGGFDQWVCNGYARGILDAIAAARLVAASPDLATVVKTFALELAARLKQMRRYIQDEDRWPPNGHYVREGAGRRFRAFAGECDTWYYANNGAWAAAVEWFLSAYVEK